MIRIGILFQEGNVTFFAFRPSSFLIWMDNFGGRTEKVGNLDEGRKTWSMCCVYYLGDCSYSIHFLFSSILFVLPLFYSPSSKSELSGYIVLNCRV